MHELLGKEQAVALLVGRAAGWEFGGTWHSSLDFVDYPVFFELLSSHRTYIDVHLEVIKRINERIVGEELAQMLRLDVLLEHLLHFVQSLLQLQIN